MSLAERGGFPSVAAARMDAGLSRLWSSLYPQICPQTTGCDDFSPFAETAYHPYRPFVLLSVAPAFKLAVDDIDHAVAGADLISLSLNVQIFVQCRICLVSTRRVKCKPRIRSSTLNSICASDRLEKLLEWRKTNVFESRRFESDLVFGPRLALTAVLPWCSRWHRKSPQTHRYPKLGKR